MPSPQPATNGKLPTSIGVGAAILNGVMFTVIGVIALDDVVYGGVMGVLTAVGAFLFLPWFLGISAAQEQSDGGLSFREAAERVTPSVGRGTFGLGLEAGAIVMLAVAFWQNGAPLVAGTAVALTVALAVYLVGSVLLTR
ncbi:hypothetical protein JCM17823_04110 [Halorubrum gandharaense]